MTDDNSMKTRNLAWTTSTALDEEVPAAKQSRRKKTKIKQEPPNSERQRPGKKRLRKMRYEQKQLSKTDYLVVCANNVLFTGSVRLLPGSPSASSHVTIRSSAEKITNEKITDMKQSGVNEPVVEKTPATACFINVQPLLVLDVNGILCHRIRRGKESDNCDASCFRPAVAHVGGTPIISRTDLPAFLTFLDQHFCLAIWTSAKSKTATSLVKTLVPEEIAGRLLFVWAQHNCTVDRSQGEEPVFVKDLAAVWKAYPLWNSHNTLLMDDSPDKSAHVANAVHPTPIQGRLEPLENQRSDEENQVQQRSWFDGLVQHWKEYAVVQEWHGDDVQTTSAKAQQTFLEEHPLERA